MNTCITVDVEDWIQSTWDRNAEITNISSDNVLRLLDLLDEISIRTTMFIQGKFAKQFPKIVKKISMRGHEVASHGFNHTEVFNQTKDEFKSDVLSTKKLLEDLIGRKVIGYRAPDFSIVKRTLWALEILSEVGYEYDSSIFPILHPRYGIAKFPIGPSNIKLRGIKLLTEFPIATINIFGKNLPVGGGGYLRLIPGLIYLMIARRVVRKNLFVFYSHPYEFNPDEFSRMEIKIPLLTRLHQGIGRRFFSDRFIMFAKHFGSSPISEVHNQKRSWGEIELTQFEL